jgi:hypothetical protein
MAEEIDLSLEDYFYIEAKERCYEIEIKGIKEYEKEKTRVFEQDKVAVMENIERLIKKEEAERRM